MQNLIDSPASGPQYGGSRATASAIPGIRDDPELDLTRPFHIRRAPDGSRIRRNDTDFELARANATYEALMHERKRVGADPHFAWRPDRRSRRRIAANVARAVRPFLRAPRCARRIISRVVPRAGARRPRARRSRSSRTRARAPEPDPAAHTGPEQGSDSTLAIASARRAASARPDPDTTTAPVSSETEGHPPYQGRAHSTARRDADTTGRGGITCPRCGSRRPWLIRAARITGPDSWQLVTLCGPCRDVLIAGGAMLEALEDVSA